MGLFVCAKCNAVENTSLGLYWSKDRPEMFVWDESNEKFKGLPLCSACRPVQYSDGSGKGDMKREWHGRFPKQDYDQWKTTEEGLCYERQGYYLMYKS